MASASFATSAPAQALGIVWDESRAFETNAAVVSGKFAEVCGKLSRGEVVVWKFEGDRLLDFNIHYHAGSRSSSPTSEVPDASGELTVTTDQDYYWMWTNRTETPGRVALKLRLR